VCEEGDGGASIGDAELYNVVYIHTGWNVGGCFYFIFLFLRIWC
jgi:hypothetical protein